MAVDTAGNVYVADTGNHAIRRMTPSGNDWVVNTFAGSAGHPGSNDGPASVARFSGPSGLAFDNSGSLYVADTFNDTIRRITSAGVVTTLAGSPIQSGSVDGSGSAARFLQPRGIVLDSAGNIYVADTGNSRITKGTPVLQFDSAWGFSAAAASFRTRLIGPSGGSAIIEASSDLRTWAPVQTNTFSSGILDLSLPLGTSESKALRARLVP
jgi:streptogramin lyase